MVRKGVGAVAERAKGGSVFVVVYDVTGVVAAGCSPEEGAMAAMEKRVMTPSKERSDGTMTR